MRRMGLTRLQEQCEWDYLKFGVVGSLQNYANIRLETCRDTAGYQIRWVKICVILDIFNRVYLANCGVAMY
jgi:hypothetical protein